METRLGLVWQVVVVLGVVFVLGSFSCTKKAKAERIFRRYKKVFLMCKDLHKKKKLQPGAHGCARGTSLALEMSLRSTGLKERRWRMLLHQWLHKEKLVAYYVRPPQKR